MNNVEMGLTILNNTEIELKAAEIRDRLGGKIFAFPVNEQDPFSKYVLAVFTGAEYNAYPETFDISEVASCIQEILTAIAAEGLDADFERNVRLVSYEAQMNAPSVTMRRLRDGNRAKPSGFLKQGDDINPTDDGYNFTARGLIKFSYLQMIDDDLPKAAQFMNKYYELLAMKRYGKTAAAIKQEVRKMDKHAAVKWIERTYAKYISDAMEVMNIMTTLKTSS